MRSIYCLEMIMKRKSVLIVTAFFLFTLVLSSCNAFRKQPAQSQNQIPSAGSTTPRTSLTPTHATAATTPRISPTPLPSPTAVTPASSPTRVPSLCDNLYQPHQVGDSWEYSGSTSATGAYTRSDTITASSDKGFTVESKVSNVTYFVDYSCSDAGLTSVNPIQQYLGALVTGPNAPVKVTLTSNSGISLPATINTGDSWQQVAGWAGSINNTSTSGRAVLDYNAVGSESITVPLGTFNALKVNATIRIEVTAFRILAGTYTSSFWLVRDIGIVKSEGTSHIPGVEFMDTLELVDFVSPP
jgi:hypothetical protein